MNMKICMTMVRTSFRAPCSTSPFGSRSYKRVRNRAYPFPDGAVTADVYHRSMRRTSQLAIGITKALARQGHTIEPRRLERWCADGLGAAEQLSFEVQVAHYAQLSHLSRSGHDVDVTARRLAARGFGCARLRGSLLGAFGVGAFDRPTPTIDLSTSPSADENFAVVERIAHAMVADSRGLPPLMVKAVAALRRNAMRYSEQLGESADEILHSFIVNNLCRMLGDELYNPKALAAVLNIDPAAFGSEALDLLNRGRVIPTDIDESYRSASIEDIVAVAQLGREHGPELLDHLGITGVSEAEIEELAATFAPLVVYLVKLGRSQFDDFPALLPSMARSLPEVGQASPLTA